MRYIFFLILSSYTAAHSIPYGFDAVRVTVFIIGFLLLLHALLKTELGRLFNPYLASLFFLLAGSIIWSIDRGLTIKYLIATLPFFGTFIAASMLTKTREDFLNWKYYFLILLIMTSLYTLLVYHAYGSVRLPAETKAIATDIVYDLIVAFPVIIYLYGVSRHPIHKLVYFALLTAGLTALMITQSRGGLIALGVGVMCSAYLLLVNKRFKIPKRTVVISKTLTFIVLLLVIVIASWQFLLDEEFKAKFLMRMMPLSPDAAVRAEYLLTYNERIVAFEDMIRQIKSHWGLGIGFGAFPAVSRNEVIVHNFILDMFISAGLMGLAVGIVFIVYIFRGFYSRAKDLLAEGDVEGAYFAIALTVSFIMFMVHGMFQHLWFFNHLYVFAALANVGRINRYAG